MIAIAPTSRADLPLIFYRRVSTQRQAQTGVSLGDQLDVLAQWATANNRRILADYADEGKSGRKMNNRDGLNDAIRHACKEPAALTVLDLSRLHRSLLDAATTLRRILKADADIISLYEPFDIHTAMGRLMYHQISLFADYRVDADGEKSKDARKNAKRQGRKVGGRREFGYDVKDGLLVPNDHEQEALKRGLSMRDRGAKFQSIAEFWHKHGYTKKLMHRATVSKIIKRQLAERGNL